MSCNYCGKEFVRAGAFEKHECETKRRVKRNKEKDSQIAYECYRRFYLRYYKKHKSFLEFAKSSYYNAFLSFGIYCNETRVIQPYEFSEYLLSKSIPVDYWTKDTHYENFLIIMLVNESMETALERTLDFAVMYQKTMEYDNDNFFETIDDSYAICRVIQNGRISPWVIYNCASGQKFLSNLDDFQQKMIWKYIDPDIWGKKFLIRKNDRQTITEILKAMGW